GGRPTGQPRHQRPSRQRPLAPPHRSGGPAPELGGEQDRRANLLGGHWNDQPTAPGLEAPAPPKLQRPVLGPGPGVATARRAGIAGPPRATPLPPHRPLD